MKHSAPKGFALTEMVLIIAVVAILAVVAVSIVLSQSTINLDAAAKQVYTHIQYARQYAMAQNPALNAIAGASFSSGGSYTVYTRTGSNPNVLLKDPQTVQDMSITLSTKYPGVTISNPFTVEFTFQGVPTMTPSGTTSVTLSAGTQSKVITVTANTGRITLQ